MHTLWGLTSREGELNLLVNDLQSDEVMFFIESAVIEKQSVSLSGSKPAETDMILGLLLDSTAMKSIPKCLCCLTYKIA